MGGLIAIGNADLKAQAIKFDGEVRTRTELRDGMREPIADTLNSALVSNLRTRLNLSYTSNLLKAKITLQDTHTYGSTLANATGNGLGIYEAWGEYLFAPGASVALGRQAIQYDDKRIFSVANWSNTGNAHDLCLLKYASTSFTTHLGLAYNNASDVMVESKYDISYKTMEYLWVGKSMGITTLSAIAVNESFQKGTTAQLLKELTYRNTVGLNFAINAPESKFYTLLSGYYQFGHDKVDKKLKAYLVAGKSQYRITDRCKITFGGDYFSGNEKDISKTEDHGFNKLYGNNHFFNGSIEFWTTLPAQGLVDIYGGFEFLPLKNLSLDLSFHKFDLADAPTLGNKDLGSELDFTATYDVSPLLSLQGGWSGYDVTQATRIIKGKQKTETRFPQWAYIMVSFKPKFL